jgi:hypothetical protein
MTSGAQDRECWFVEVGRPRMLVCRGWSGLPWCSHSFPSVPGAEVHGAREGS